MYNRTQYFLASFPPVAQLDLGLATIGDGTQKEELCPGTAKSEKALVSLFEAQRELKEEMDTSKTLRMERVKAKLATVMVRLSLDRLF